MGECKFDDCGSFSWKKGYCPRHYSHARRHGLLPLPPCKVDGCERPVHGAGLCSMHHHRRSRHGDENVVLKPANGTAHLLPCKHEGCGKPSRNRSLCAFHGGYWRRNGLFTKRACVVDGCDRFAYEGSEYCNTHKQRFLRYGDVNFRKKLANGEQTPERKREVYRGIWRRYRAKPHGKLRSAFHGASRRLHSGRSAKVTKHEFSELWNSSTCGICGLPVDDADKTIDHIIPLSRGGTNECSNLQIAHSRCNKRKGNRVPATASSNPTSGGVKAGDALGAKRASKKHEARWT